MIKRFYDKLIYLSSHPLAMIYMGIISFLESSILPIPPDVMIIPMVVSNPKRAFLIALWATITSVIGGLVGYWIGYALYDTLGYWIISMTGNEKALVTYQSTFADWGFWIIALKGFTPIPYKVVTIASGLAQYDMIKFITASIIARGFRFGTLCGLLWYFGEPIKKFIDKNMGMFFILIFVFIVVTLGTVLFIP